jgi:hypothetical protein
MIGIKWMAEHSATNTRVRLTKVNAEHQEDIIIVAPKNLIVVQDQSISLLYTGQ